MQWCGTYRFSAQTSESVQTSHIFNLASASLMSYDRFKVERAATWNDQQATWCHVVSRFPLHFLHSSFISYFVLRFMFLLTSGSPPPCLPLRRYTDHAVVPLYLLALLARVTTNQSATVTQHWTYHPHTHCKVQYHTYSIHNTLH